jgi:bifunctional N-acetylglucosamine-1-phosphate-uridyltransferase/glucosamine-1-phosphate-acetyltransferase GlmU-like protein
MFIGATWSGIGARSCLTIVLAAGEGTRMRSSRPKVLHAIGGRPLIAHVLEAVKEIDGAVAVVIGPGQDRVAARVTAMLPSASLFIQVERRGTAHAVSPPGRRSRTAQTISSSCSPTPRWCARRPSRDGAYVGSGSVITRNVPADALAVGRGRQEIKEGWASRFRNAKPAGPTKAD